ncbi:MAG: diguanylate cyclase [Gammaproteobacteria bacterium]|nr:diguanylate cyclase [Gammaproteobacteria bacterium]
MLIRPTDAALPPQAASPAPSGPLIFIIASVLYLLLAQMAMLMNNPVSSGGSFWPASGLMLGILMRLPTARWVWVIAGIAVSEFLGDISYGYPLSAALLWTIGNCLEPLLAAMLIRRSGNHAGTLRPLSNLLRFMVFAVLLAPLVAATIGSMGTIVIMETPFWQAWPKYVVGDALGMLVMAPVLLSWEEPKAVPRRVIEGVVLGLCLVLMCLLAFRNWDNIADGILPYLFMPLMIWAALRFGLRGVSWTILLTANAANIATGLGYGPFSAAIDPAGHGITLLQILLAITSATALVVAALTNDLIDGIKKETRLQYQANHDLLTGLYNRPGLSLRLAQLRLNTMDKAPISLLMCDLDDFKGINDTYGHLAGDEVLIEVARRLRNSIRDDDTAARLGGDEFAVLLNNGDKATVDAITQRILDTMAQPFHGSFGASRITVSIGIATMSMEQDPQLAFNAADAALYRAKHEGKNRSVRALKLAA